MLTVCGKRVRVTPTLIQPHSFTTAVNVSYTPTLASAPGHTSGYTTVEKCAYINNYTVGMKMTLMTGIITATEK